LKSDSNPLPDPRPDVASPGLWRPDWVSGEPRDPNKLWLDKNENADPVLVGVVKEALTAAQHTVAIYPEAAPLYQKLARHLGVDPENLVLAAGSDGAIRATFEAYISPGDRIVHTSPTFAMYAVYCQMYGAEAHAAAYEASGTGPRLHLDRLRTLIEDVRPKLVCLPNPDSPTGTVVPPDDLKALVELTAQTGSLLLIDEAYYPFYAETALPWVAQNRHLIVTRSTGKAWGMAGLRLGIAVASRDVATALHKVRGMYETGAVSMAVMAYMIDRYDAVEASVKRLTSGKELFLEEMSALGFRTLKCHGNFSHIAFASHAEKIHAALADQVYYRKESNDGCLAGFSRFSSTTPELFRPIIETIKSTVR
jgi:histidinol-phosphate aminotransferase